MSRYDMKVPDVGEGVAEAELVEWMVAVGDRVTPDTVIAEVLTDKATVEISAPVPGEVVSLHGEPGDLLAVGGDLIAIETDGVEPPSPADQPAEPEPTHAPPEAPTPPEPRPTPPPPPPAATAPARPAGGRATAAPAVRTRAADLGIDLETVRGTGPDGRVLHDDLDRHLREGSGSSTPAAPPLRRATDGGRPDPVRGVRRRIAQRLSDAWRDIPHITYVEEVDVSELERLRAVLNQSAAGDHRLTLLPFLARAIVVAVADQPGLNAHYDHEAEILTTFEAVHVGIATQTPDGLRVPVVRHCEGRGVRDLGAELRRVTAAARDGSASRNELAGSTITITSLGALGGLATTPIINPPEVAIVGVNKIDIRPVWADGAFVPRKMMNLSCSFDHRMVDGWDAAIFVQRLKQLIEIPALLYATDD